MISFIVISFIVISFIVISFIVISFTVIITHCNYYTQGTLSPKECEANNGTTRMNSTKHLVLLGANQEEEEEEEW